MIKPTQEVDTLQLIFNETVDNLRQQVKLSEVKLNPLIVSEAVAVINQATQLVKWSHEGLTDAEYFACNELLSMMIATDSRSN